MNDLLHSLVTPSLVGATLRIAIALVVVVAAAGLFAGIFARHRPALRANSWLQALMVALLTPLAIVASGRLEVAFLRVTLAEASASAPLDRSAPPTPLPERPGDAGRGEASAEASTDSGESPEPPAVLATPRRTDSAAATEEHPAGAAFPVTPAGAGPSTSGKGSGSTSTGADPTAVPPRFADRAVPVLALAWLFGVLFALARLGLGCRRIAAIRREAVPLPATARLPLDRVALALGIDGPPLVLVSDRVASACVIGLRTPAVVVPRAWLDRLDEQAWFEVLVHEAAHVQRRDPWIALLQRVAAAVYWPHPFIHLLNRRLTIAREETCDNFVLRTTRADRYAETLVELTGTRSRGGVPALSPSLVPARWRLEARIRGLLDRARVVSTRPRLRQIAAASITLGASLAVVAGTAFVVAAATARPHDEIHLVAGVVRDHDGSPVGNATVFALDEVNYEALVVGRATTDADGRYRLEVARNVVVSGREHLDPLTRIKVAAVAAGHGISFGDVSTPDVREQADFRFPERDATIRGRILDLEGVPRAGARIRVIEVSVPEHPEAGYGTGEPGATLRVGPALESIFASRTTDAEGRFELDGVGLGRRVVLVVDAPGVERRPFAVTADHGITKPGILGPTELLTGDAVMSSEGPGGGIEHYGLDFVHHVPGADPLVGRIVERDTGRPVPGVRIEASFGANTFEILTTTSDGDGRYVLHGVPDHEDLSSLRFQPPIGTALLRRFGDYRAKGAGTEKRVDIALERGVLVRGRIVDRENGTPVRARLEAGPAAGNDFASRTRFGDSPWALGAYLRTTTDYEGRFELVTTPGAAILTVTALEDRFATADAEILEPWLDDEGRVGIGGVATIPETTNAAIVLNTQDGADPVVLEVPLSNGLTRKVVVADDHDLPLEGCVVSGRTPLFYGTQAVPNAEFEVLGLKRGSVRQIVIRHPERRLGRAINVGLRRGRTPMAVELAPCGTVRGRLVDREGTPVRHSVATIMLVTTRENGLSAYHVQEWAETDAQGNFGFDAVPNVVYFVLGEHVLVRSGEERELGDVRLTWRVPQ